MQRCHADVFDASWSACIEDAKFLVCQDGTVQLSNISETESQKASVCLSPTQRTFAVQFLAKIGRSLIAQSSKSAAMSKGEVFGVLIC